MDFARLREDAAFLSIPHAGRAESLARDIETRLHHPSIFVSSFDPVESSSYILQKTILSNWMLTLAFLARDFNSLKFDVLAEDSVELDKSGPILNDLMSSRNLLARCNRMVKGSAELTLQTRSTSSKGEMSINPMKNYSPTTGLTLFRR